MVNAASDTAQIERRERARPEAAPARALGAPPSLNPFGDLHVLQHLSARLARSLKLAFEPFLRRSLRSWAEPLEVMRWADYRAERKAGLTAWAPIAMNPGKGRVLLVMDGQFVLEMLDCFFGGEGEAPSPLPEEFTASADSIIARAADAVARPLASAWDPLARIEFAHVPPELSYGAPPDLDGEGAMVVARFGLAVGDAAPVWLDLLYPVAALKPYAPTLTAKVQSEADPDPEWRNGLTRAAMAIRLPVRAVLCEPSITLGQLAELKPGEVLPITFGAEAPLWVGTRKLGTGMVGTQNGRAAICLTSIEQLSEEDFR